MNKTIFYKKVGRRYEPVYEYDQTLMDALPKGDHLISVYPGGRSTRYNVNPNYVALIAAGRVAGDAISKHIMEKSALRTPERNKPITPEQKAAWDRLAELMGNDRYALEYCSYREAAEEGVKAMMEEAEKLLSNPTVRKSFEKFLMVCELTKENK